MTDKIDLPQKNYTQLFDVFLRLRPPTTQAIDRFLIVEKSTSSASTQVTINPPLDDYRKRAIERYSFTQVFEEYATQLDVFHGTNILPLLQGVVGTHEKAGKDGLLATLGVTGSGKSHTILGSKTQRGLTQITLDILFHGIGNSVVQPQHNLSQLAANDVSDAQLCTAADFIESIYGEEDSCVSSRAQTPLPVSVASFSPAHTKSFWGSYKSKLGIHPESSPSHGEGEKQAKTIRPVTGIARITRSVAKTRYHDVKEQSQSIIYPSLPKPNTTSKRYPPRPSSLPQLPSVENFHIDIDPSAEYAVILSMYEVYNNRICDLLSGTTITSRASSKETWKPSLLFKSTEFSPDRKVVAGLRKIICASLNEALMVLETGLTERAVAGTGSNAVSSRSHGFFCIEVKKRKKGSSNRWSGTTMTIADLAGSERARAANTYGNTLAEAGKINQSLMLLGQCMQAQSGISGTSDLSLSKLAIRQCKLTELLFSNVYHHPPSSLSLQQPRQQQQRAIMIVTADPRGDYNATSQILKYSALAKETTVPRVPSVTSTLYQGNPFNLASALRHPQTSASDTTETTEETIRLTAALATLQAQLEEEKRLRHEMEASWSHAEQRIEGIEAEVREECWNSFEQQMQTEREKWRAAWDEEKERNEGHMDNKLDVLMRGITIDNDHDNEEKSPTANITAIKLAKLTERLEEFERENEMLRFRVATLEREKMSMRTPSRKIKVLKARPWNIEDVENLSL